ncbi:hypothetical protein [Burkholderia ubonensis]|uniref:hypothetical protein n=1 Tax=Burkholderia ubonensis TaxID=101571 RepID=UPI000A60A2B9|nr:hypothetical protein [Burkholderia ubonensis]
MSSGFVRPSRKPTVDPAALERFANGADERRAAVGASESLTAPPAATPSPVPAQQAAAAPVTAVPRTPADTPAPTPVIAASAPPAAVERRVAAPKSKAPAEVAEKASESVLWRVTPSTLDLYNFVFENTNVKSKQKLLDLILIPELERRAEEIRKRF